MYYSNKFAALLGMLVFTMLPGSVMAVDMAGDIGPPLI